MTTVAIDFGTSNTVISYLDSDTNAATSVRLNQIARVFKPGQTHTHVFLNNEPEKPAY